MNNRPRWLAWRAMFGIREKLSLCFAGLLIIVMALGFHSIYQTRALGASINRILEENFESVLASDTMQKGAGRIDSGILFWLMDRHALGTENIKEGRRLFEVGYQQCLARALSDTERKRLEEIRKAYDEYDRMVFAVLAAPPLPGEENEIYLTKLEPLYTRIDELANAIQQISQAGIVIRQGAATERANVAVYQTMAVLAVTLILACVAIYLSGRWVLLPVLQLTHAAESIRRGNLDVRVEVASDDELGALTRTFNEMAQRLRVLTRTQKASLLKAVATTNTIMENLSDAIALVTTDGTVEMSSRVAIEVFQLAPSSLLAETTFPWIEPLVRRAALEKGAVFGGMELEHVQVFLSGEERYFFPTAMAIHDDEGELTGTLLFFRDVTGMLLQQELKQDAIATVSHQLKTPLTAIQMALHLLSGGRFGSLSEKQKDLVDTAREESDRLLSMVLGLLDISRLKAGKFDLELEPTEVSDLLALALDAVRAEAEAKDVRVFVESVEGLPQIQVDASRVEHVFQNILGNGIRYSPPGSMMSVAAVQDGDGVRVDVLDEGPGITTEECAKVFEQYYRGSASEHASGSGLGLYIARKMVEAHGGRIWARGMEGGGSCFSVWLPFMHAPEAATDGPETERNTPSTET